MTKIIIQRQKHHDRRLLPTSSMQAEVTRKTGSTGRRMILALPLYPGQMNDFVAIVRVLTGAGDLMVFTGHGPTPPEGGTYYRWWRDIEPHSYYIPRLIYPLARFLLSV
ncbi:hypothetical protein AVEN_130862-1 [Araneus ventricosus]|uniref:Uncharacterized protein n=1 Tax=Araneus ventricosus TaxID=182803 RepID=A0A4Y2JT49_ARAVE|nr:hypothetical protein AVEN_130862-1 [Araneus ventricosus]